MVRGCVRESISPSPAARAGSSADRKGRLPHPAYELSRRRVEGVAAAEGRSRQRRAEGREVLIEHVCPVRAVETEGGE